NDIVRFAEMRSEAAKMDPAGCASWQGSILELIVTCGKSVQNTFPNFLIFQLHPIFGHYDIIRDVLIRVDPTHLDRALRRWNEVYAGEDESLALDGKTMGNALDEHVHQTHVMSVIGHQTQICY